MAASRPLLDSEHAKKITVSDDGKKLYWNGSRIIFVPRILAIASIFWSGLSGFILLAAAAAALLSDSINVVSLFRGAADAATESDTLVPIEHVSPE